jgi:hypothetical protein
MSMQPTEQEIDQSEIASLRLQVDILQSLLVATAKERDEARAELAQLISVHGPRELPEGSSVVTLTSVGTPNQGETLGLKSRALSSALAPADIKARLDALGATEESVRAQVSALAKLEGRDERDLYECSVDELTLLTKVYHDAAAPVAKTAFANFLAVLTLCAEVAGPIATIAGAFGAVFGAVAAGKAAG